MAHATDVPAVSPEVLASLAPRGVLRAGINCSNPLLVSGRAENGDPDGVSPDMARLVAEALGVECRLIPYASPGELGDAVAADEWDIGLIGAEPQRARTIFFSPPYVGIEACYLVRSDSSFTTPESVDRPNVRILTTSRAAFTLWLERNVRHASIIAADGLDQARDMFVDGKGDVLASLKPKLLEDPLPETRLVAPGFMTVQQAIGIAHGKDAAAAWLSDLVYAACRSGFVAERIKSRGVIGLDAAKHG